MPMDWEAEFYAATDWERGAYVGGEDMADHLATFLDRVGVPESVCSVGCGPAAAEFSVAERYPDTEFRCYDIAPSVVAANREKAREEGLDNVSFAVDSLPDLAVEGAFGLVYCVAVLYFVADVEDALRALYDRVAPGGHLVFTYPNSYLRAWVRDLPEGQKREAFSLVEVGRNLLTYDDVEDLLGTRPRSYWTFVGARDEEYASRRAPAVFVPKRP